MKRILFFGGSITYGVADTEGGFVNRIKRDFHNSQFGGNAGGEGIEIYNFARPGATIEFVDRIYPTIIKNFGKNGKIITAISVGMNNSKAVNAPNNYISTLRGFSKKINNLLVKLQKLSDKVLAIGYTPVDETKTFPKLNPIDGGTSYWTNSRLEAFNNEFKNAAKRLKIEFINMFAILDKKEWTEKYLYKDGLHPNTEGHNLLYLKIRPALTKIL